MKLYLQYNPTTDFFNKHFFYYLSKHFEIIKEMEKADIIIFYNFSMYDRKYFIKNHNKHIYFSYIYEPATLNTTFEKKIFKRINNRNITLLTYSKANYNLLKERLNNKIILLPPNYSMISDLKFNKSINFVINYRNKDKYRDIYNNYNNTIISKDKLNDFIILNHWNEQKEILFKNTKIFINLHKLPESNILELFRISHLIVNRVIIISQHCLLQQNEFLSNYVIFVDNNQLINKANEVLQNYEFYYNKIYNNKTNKEIFKEIDFYWNQFLQIKT